MMQGKPGQLFVFAATKNIPLLRLARAAFVGEENVVFWENKDETFRLDEAGADKVWNTMVAHRANPGKAGASRVRQDLQRYPINVARRWSHTGLAEFVIVHVDELPRENGRLDFGFFKNRKLNPCLQQWASPTFILCGDQLRGKERDHAEQAGVYAFLPPSVRDRTTLREEVKRLGEERWDEYKRQHPWSKRHWVFAAFVGRSITAILAFTVGVLLSSCRINQRRGFRPRSPSGPGTRRAHEEEQLQPRRQG